MRANVKTKLWVWILLGGGISFTPMVSAYLENIALNAAELNYQFGKSKPTQVDHSAIYDTQTKFGFDFSTAQKVDIKQLGFVAKESVYFSVGLPEGRYKISLTLGSDVTDSINTIKAESRRLMINQLELKKGQIVTKDLMVDVRTPRISDTESILIKEREKDDLNWDDKLTLEFSSQSAIQTISITAVNSIPVIYLAGDSTVTDQDIEPWASWGQLFTQYLNTDWVLANYAVSGASLHSFKQNKRLDKVMSLIKQGDYLFIQFGHNDEKRKGQGIGPWQSYTQLLTEYVTLAREKGAHPVLLTPVQRRFFNADGTLKPTHGDYPAAVRAVAKKLTVPLIDLTELTSQLYQSWGDMRSRQAFVQYPANTFPNQPKKLKDNTHFNYFGANEVALCVVKGLVDKKHILVEYLNKQILNYDPLLPNTIENWSVPMSPRFTAVKPDGI